MQLINGVLLMTDMRAANRKMRISPIIQDVIGLYSPFPKRMRGFADDKHQQSGCQSHFERDNSCKL